MINKSYQLNHLEVRSYLGKHHLSFPTTASLDEITDIEDVFDADLSDDDDNHLEHVTVTGIQQLETIYKYKKQVQPTNSTVGTCASCNTIKKLSASKQTAKLFVQCGSERLTLRAYDSTNCTKAALEYNSSRPSLFY